MADPPGSTSSNFSRSVAKPTGSPPEDTQVEKQPKRTKPISPRRQEPQQRSPAKQNSNSNEITQKGQSGAPALSSPRKSNGSSSKDVEDRIGKLLTRCQRQFSAQRPSEQSSNFQVPARPPDQAATSLGRELADAFLQSLDFPSDNDGLKASRHKLLESLVNRGIHPSIPHAFFEELTNPNHFHRYQDSRWDEWLPAFLLQCEQKIIEELPNTGTSIYDDEEASGLNETLAAALRAYATSFSVAVASNPTRISVASRRKFDEVLTITYRRLQTHAARTILIREFSRAVRVLERIPQQISPLMAACVLTLWATPHSEKNLLLQELFRQVWDVIYQTDAFGQFWDILMWLTESLNLFLMVLPSASRLSRDNRPAWRELAQGWLTQLGDMISFVVHAANSDEASSTGPLSTERLLAEWLQIVLNKLLPIIATQGAGSYRLSLEPLLEQLNSLIVEMDDSRIQTVQLNTTVVFKLSTMALSTPLKGETRCILSLFSYLLPSESVFARALTSTVGAIYLSDETCQAAAKHLLKTAQGVDQQLTGIPGRTKTSSAVHLLEEGEDGYELLKFLASINAEELNRLSAVKQIESLLFGIVMMESTSETVRKAAPNFVKGLLQRYQHLGLSLMPSLIADINAAALEKSPSELLAKLEFLADSVTVDPSCAQQAWNLLGVEMLASHNPVSLRVTILRLLPRLCVANKRLYRRVMDTLGAHRDGKLRSGDNTLTPESMSVQVAVLEVRLAVAASIADLAKEDLIRDVSDCIGWIQEFLVEDYSESPMKALLVHYAVLSLHYLLVSQELDFNLVLKVLKKRLCNVNDKNDVSQLPPVVQEALALLLGDGECKEESEDEESDEKDDAKSEAQISPQVVGAVQALIDLGIQYETVEPDEALSLELIARIRRNIILSLSKYSLDALGLDEDGIKAAVELQEQGDTDAKETPVAAMRYVSLRQLAANGIQLPQSLKDKVEDFDTLLVDFNAKVLKFEEEALSSSLWATKGTRHNVVQPRKDSSKASVKDSSSLPAPSKLQALYKQNPSNSTVLARLLCFEGSSLKKFLSLAGEATFQEREPMALVFLFQAFLNSCSRMLGQLYDGGKFRGFGQTLEEIRRWGLQTGNMDAMFLIFAGMTVYLPQRDDKNESNLVENVHTEVFQAFKNLQFQNNDVAKIALALTAVSAFRWGFNEQLFDVINSLEQSVKGYGGQMSFGAAYGLGLIAQAISHGDQAGASGSNNRTLKSRVGHIIGFLVGETVACTETKDRSDVLTTLVACLQSGVSTPGLVGSLAELVSKQFSVVPAKNETAKYLFISLGLCLPSLSQVSSDLLLGALFLLERFQWGSGKGIALVPVLQEAKKTGILVESETERIFSEYSRIFDQFLGEGDASDFGCDLCYAVMGTSSKPSPHVLRQYLSNTSRRFDDNRCTSPLISAFVSIASFPTLGFNSTIFTAPLQLRHDISKVAIESILEVLTGALMVHTDSRNAVMTLGCLASMKNQPAEIGTISVVQDKVPAPGASSKLKSLNLDFALLPSPRQGTLLYDLMGLIQRAHQSEQSEQLKNMMKYMKCIEALSLPGHYSKHFLEPLISENNETTKDGCISLLFSQVCGRRRAVFDGRDFTNMALQISIMPLVSFNALLGSGKAAAVFVKCLAGIVRTLPSELVENGTKNLWEICVSISEDTNLIVEFLLCMQSILKAQASRKQNNLSPKTKKFLEEFITTRIFSDLRELSWATSLGEKAAADERTVLQAYVNCLTELPLASLEQFEIFVFHQDDSFTGEVLRALVILELVQCKYFADATRRMRELSKILAWFTRKFIAVDGVYLETMRRIACAISAATKVLQNQERREILLSILEQLLLCQPTACAIGVDLLAALLASWCSDVATDGDLSMAYVCIHATDKLQSLSDAALNQVFAFFRHDLPWNIAIYGRSEKIGAIVANQIWRLYSTWSKNGADEEILKCLKKAFICGSSSDTKEDDFVSLTSSILLESDSIESGQNTLLR